MVRTKGKKGKEERKELNGSSKKSLGHHFSNRSTGLNILFNCRSGAGVMWCSAGRKRGKKGESHTIQ